MSRANARHRSARVRGWRDRAFLAICASVAGLSVLVLAWLVGEMVVQGVKHLDWEFLTSFPSRKPELAGFKSALWGSIWIVTVCAAVALPLGVATAVFLEEYGPRRRAWRALHSFISLNISNLAGVPSIVYGIIGLTVFVRMFGLFGSPNLSTYERWESITLLDGTRLVGRLIEAQDGSLVVDHPIHGVRPVDASRIQSRDRDHVRLHHLRLADGRGISGPRLDRTSDGLLEIETQDRQRIAVEPASIVSYSASRVVEIGNEDSFFYFRLPLGGSVLAGGLTLMLVILPIVIISCREALRAVPASLREGALALGATRWQCVHRMVLPAAVPGIMTGSILAISRAIGEAAPLLVVGGLLVVFATPKNVMDDFAAMPLQIFNWAGRPQEEFHRLAASGILVLLAVLVAFNLSAIVIRQKFQKPPA